MPLKIQCPACRKIATIPDSASGKNARCGCGQVITIPIILSQPTPTVLSEPDDFTLQPPPARAPDAGPTIKKPMLPKRPTSGTGKYRPANKQPRDESEPKPTMTAADKAKQQMQSFIALVFLLLVAIGVIAGIKGAASNPGSPSHGGANPTPTTSANTPEEAYSYAVIFAKEGLKAPSTAEFPAYYAEWVSNLGDGRYRVSAHVDSQNGFGAMLRTRFSCVLRFRAPENDFVLEPPGVLYNK